MLAWRALSSSATPPAAPLILILDIDETLVRVRCEGVHDKRKRLESPCFNMSVDLGRSQVFDCAVVRRPGLDSFLQWIQERKAAGLIEGPYLFTTSSKKYTKALLKFIDPGGKIFGLRVLARQACTPAGVPGFALKDLDVVPPSGEAAGRRKLLVDNNPVSHVLYPGGAVLVRDWLGEDQADGELRRVQELVDALLADPEARATGDYTKALSRLTPDRGEPFRRELLALREKLAETPPADLVEVRARVRAVAADANDLKRNLLGGAP